MKKLIILAALTSTLYGCIAAVPAALVVGATAGGSVVYDQRTFRTMRNDQTATQAAQYWISTDPALKKHTHINVTVYNGIGLLVGQAQTEALRDKAYQILVKIPHVKRVYNAITISGQSSSLQRTNDSIITGKVRTTLLAERGLQSNNIKVVTENGVVYLMGSITRRQADIATNAARHVSGVLKVVKVFTYL